MELRKAFYKNFAAVRDITVNISPGINFIVGNNGAGKTTVGLNGVWFVLKGLAQKGSDVFHAERFRFIGPNGKNATGGLVFHDETEDIDITVTRKLTKSKTELKITTSDGRKLDQAFLDEIFNVFTINIFSFSKLGPKEQSLALGLDTSEFDQERSDLYAERRDIAREVKRLKTVVESCPQQTKVESVNLPALLEEKNRIDKENLAKERDANKQNAAHVVEVNEFNQKQGHKETQKKNIKEKIAGIEAEIKRLQTQIKALLEKFENCPEPEEVRTPDAPKQPELESTETLTRQISAAESINEHARQYQDFAEKSDEYDGETKKLEKVETQYADNEADRVKYIQSKKLPFSNMTIDKDGGLLISGKPFCEPYFSKGEIMRMSARLATASADDHKLKYIFIPDAQSLDEKNREKLFAELADTGWQIMAELVGDKTIGDNSILLSEGEVVENEEETMESL